ncbi:sulfotransferase 1A1-like [Lingula anatina]|uniref:Sulfotransferase 1A1-like n=1 Tax=Lingula anatina TaxID=7574 RepID=A0A1S3HT78_LINAN|nr:sulfotransferase 1A1-like [Lingula anatina]|eukprot:XP_013389242.1 sulfotransferase 1A1-like [Lingula anatina]
MTMDYIEHELASPRIFNNHLYPKHMPEGATDKVKVVCVSRNPKDIAVSMYHFNKVSPEMGYDGEWSDFLPLFLEGKGIYNSWWEYTLQWWNAEKKNPNILWLTYEDMQEDCLQQIKRVDQFLGTGRTLDFMETVNKRCSFQSMTKSLQAKHTRFFRKGEVGDWKNWFTVAQNEEFDTFHKQKMKNSDFTVRFEL